MDAEDRRFLAFVLWVLSAGGFAGVSGDIKTVAIVTALLAIAARIR